MSQSPKRCPVCEEEYTKGQGDRRPRLLHCGHTLCSTCLPKQRVCSCCDAIFPAVDNVIPYNTALECHPISSSCSICCAEYATTVPRPNRQLPIGLRCGHTFCRCCLSRVLCCPFCSRTITESLHVNYALVDAITCRKSVIRRYH